MKKQLLASKLRMPRTICNAIKRQGLLERIYEMPEQVIILHAGIGYGKTTVMADYFQTYALTYGWYQLGRTDDDMNHFLYHFETLFKEQNNQFCMHESPIDWSQEKMECIVCQILEQLEAWEGSISVVLDDFQYIENPMIFDFLSFFIRYMGDRIRIFFLIRGKFPGFLTRYLFQGVAGVIETRDLKITDAELQMYIQESGMKHEGISVGQILDCTDGWAVAVNCILTHHSEVDWSQKGLAAFLGSSNLSDYLCYEIMHTLSVKQQIFMAESSVLTKITTEACDYILEMEASGDFLDSLVRGQLLTERYGQGEYRYHPILQNFLCKQVKERRKREIWKRAAQYFCALQEEEQVVLYYDRLEQKASDGTKPEKRSTETGKLLQLTCFGGMRIHFGDEKNIVHWRTRKTKEMFAYLWEQEGRPVSKESVMDALWQEGNGQRLESLFHTTLSYLKRGFSIIGVPDLIHMDNKRYTMKRQCFHSDTQGLIRMYEIWKRGMEEMDVEREFKELTRLYQGDYMEDLDGSWVVASREYYKNIYLQCCVLLVNQAGRMQKYNLAVRVLEKALKSDPYSDRLNGMLLKNLCAMGEFQAAKQQYERYNQLLKEELNIGIGRQVQEIYQNTIMRRIG